MLITDRDRHKFNFTLKTFSKSYRKIFFTVCKVEKRQVMTGEIRASDWSPFPSPQFLREPIKKLFELALKPGMYTGRDMFGPVPFIFLICVPVPSRPA